MIITLKRPMRYYRSGCSNTLANGRMRPHMYIEFDTHTCGHRSVSSKGRYHGPWNTGYWRSLRIVLERGYVVVRPAGGSVMLPEGI